jgi:3-phosphoshikimate 1-carboxyvinyltransferase
MRRGLLQLSSNEAIDCGQAGTVFRFLALRASRQAGSHRLIAHPQLLARPQQELLPILGQLGVEAQLVSDGLILKSQGWRLAVDGLYINATRSSQFASAVVLNAWGLNFPLHFQVSQKFVSEGYFRMTLDLCKLFGMHIDETKTAEGRTEFIIPAHQQVSLREYYCEPDLSSAFAVAALAAVGGQARIRNFPKNSLQPDAVFVGLLAEMGFSIDFNNSELSVSKTNEWRGVETNLQNSPDLFPVLAALCALAKTPSHIRGVSHLKHKESSRLEKSRELLNLIGAQILGDEDQVMIQPTKLKSSALQNLTFDSSGDHRMVMAAQVLRQAGYPINVLQIESVNKSFPEFRHFLEASL